MSDHCRICLEDRPQALEEHHLLPRRHGGTDSDKNIITLCANCHRIVESIFDKAFWDRARIELAREYRRFLEGLQEADEYVAALENVETLLDDPRVPPEVAQEIAKTLSVDSITLEFDYDFGLELDRSDI